MDQKVDELKLLSARHANVAQGSEPRGDSVGGGGQLAALWLPPPHVVPGCQ